MLGQHFYFHIIRKIVVAFGTLFNNIQLVTTDEQGNLVKQEKVPLAYGPIQKFLARLRQNPDIDRPFTITIPRLSFEMVNIAYDGSRKVPPTQQFRAVASGTGNKMNVQYMPVPYNIDFELSLITKNNEDALQIVEQILPFFQPQFTVTVDLIPEMNEKRDIPIVLTGINFKDEYEDDLFTRRTIIWTLTFTAKTYLYGPVDSGNIIKKAITTEYTGDLNTNSRVVKYTEEPKAITDINGDGVINQTDTNLLTAEDDFGFNEGVTYYGQ